jgi:phospholipase C
MSRFWKYERKQYTTFGQYNGSTIPVYRDMAQQYPLGDSFCSSDPSWSLPNHWFLLAGQAPGESQHIMKDRTVDEQHLYRNEANATRTIQDRLNNSGVTWKHDSWALTTYPSAIQAKGTGSTSPESAYDGWSPLASRYESYTQGYDSHCVNRTEFFGDAAQSLTAAKGCSQSIAAVPDISWIIPAAGYSDHPSANITAGERFVAPVVNAVENSSYWNSTAIFPSWDDYGGFYDRRAPPFEAWVTNEYGRLSMRVPLIVIRPYTPAQAVIPQLGVFDSILAVIEDRWNLGCVVPGATQDCNAPLPTEFFNFSMVPRGKCLFPSTISGVAAAAYPEASCWLAGPMTSLTPNAWSGNDEGLTPTEADGPRMQGLGSREVPAHLDPRFHPEGVKRFGRAPAFPSNHRSSNRGQTRGPGPGLGRRRIPRLCIGWVRAQPEESG